MLSHQHIYRKNQFKNPCIKKFIKNTTNLISKCTRGTNDIKPDLIYSNPPYGKIGNQITDKIIELNPKQISILGTRGMLLRYKNVLACDYVYFKDYIVSPRTKCKWVEQLILLGCYGSTEVGELKVNDGRRLIEKPYEIRITFCLVNATILNLSENVMKTRPRKTSFIISFDTEQERDAAIEEFQIARKNGTLLECFIKYGFISKLIPHEGNKGTNI